MIELRDYQVNAVSAVYQYLKTHEGNPCVVLPCGSGKTPVIAQICRDVVDWKGRAVVLTFRKELIEQEHRHLIKCGLMDDVGIYSAAFDSRQTRQPIIVAGIQSVYKRAAEFGKIDLILIDECQTIPEDGEGMFRTFLTDLIGSNENVRLIGLTATPYRTTTGELCSPENLLNEICYEVGVRELIVRGFLCPLVAKAGSLKVDTSRLHTRAGEFVTEEAESLMNQTDVVRMAAMDIQAAAEMEPKRRSILVFGVTVEHCEFLAHHLNCFGIEAQVVSAETPYDERDRLFKDFREGKLRCLVNVNIASVGFDAPNVDCVALVFPTASPGKYYQCVGRGLRIHESKKSTLILDFGGNIQRHGPIDHIRLKTHGQGGDGAPPVKECMECKSIVHAAYTTCPDCGAAFPEKSFNHSGQASGVSPLDERLRWEVQMVTYTVHHKKGDPFAPCTMRVVYKSSYEYISEWVCPEHTGFPRRKFEKFWSQRGGKQPSPKTAEEAVARAETELRRPTYVTTIQDGRWLRVIDVECQDEPITKPEQNASTDRIGEFFTQ